MRQFSIMDNYKEAIKTQFTRSELKQIMREALREYEQEKDEFDRELEKLQIQAENLKLAKIIQGAKKDTHDIKKYKFINLGSLIYALQAIDNSISAEKDEKTFVQIDDSNTMLIICDGKIEAQVKLSVEE